MTEIEIEEVDEDDTYECGVCHQTVEPDWVGERHECYSQWNGPLTGEIVKVANEGVAWRVDGHSVEREEVVTHMVGDNRTFVHDVGDVTVISEDDYCAGCGQVGPPFCFGYGPPE